MTGRPGRVSSELAIDAPAARREASAPRRNTPAIAAWRRRRLAQRDARARGGGGMNERALRIAAAPAAAFSRSAFCCGISSCASTTSRPMSCRRRAWCCRRSCRRLADPVVVAARDAGDHVRGPGARRDRRRRAGHPVQPVAADRALALSLCGDPAGDAGGGDRAAAADLSAAAGRGAGLRLDRRVLSGARQHHARTQFGRPQSRRPVPALRRLALAGAVRAEAAGGAAADAGRTEDRRRPVADRRGGGRDRRGLGRRRLRPCLSHRRVRATGSTFRACSRRCCCSRSPAS